MTSITNNISTNPFKPQGKKNVNETELGLFYTNDMHGDIYRLGKFKTAHDTFLKENKNTPNLTLAAGDCLFGSDKQRNSLMIKLFNLMHLDALALGNHEFAGGSENLANSLKNAEFKSVSTNLDIDKDSPLKERIKDKKLVKSAVFMKGGHKFAVIGASPLDSYIGKNEKGIKPLNIDDTIKEINEEAKSLEKQGINKIILCSHLGYDENNDLKVARETEGIDVIVGGHTHTVIDGINTETTDKTHKLNLLMSKRNEPVLITQAGGMNKYAGYLNVIFDENGIIKTDKTKNTLVDLNQFEDSKSVSDLMNQELGKKEIVATVKNSYKPKSSYNERFDENPLANTFADAILDKAKNTTGADIALYHAATIRGGAEKEITNYDIKYTMLPFNNSIKVIDITEKDLVNVINNISGTLMTENRDPQLLRCSGMKYSVHNDIEFAKTGNKNSLIDMQIGNKNIDINNPTKNKTYKVALASYLFNHDLTKNILSKYQDNAIDIGNEQDIFIDYLKKQKEIDMSISEKRINLTAKYEGWDDYNKAKAIVANNNQNM